MSSRSSLTTLIIASVAAVLGATMVLITQPASGNAQGPVTSGASDPRRFEVIALPTNGSTERSWLLLDITTGRVEQWTEREHQYAVTTNIKEGAILGFRTMPKRQR